MTPDTLGPTPTRFLLRTGVRIVLTAFAVLLALSLAAVAALLALSPGRTAQFLDTNGAPVSGSISQKLRVTINGVDQGMFIRGRDRTKPVLLFVHGGPGMPEYAISERYPAVLEELFIVCWWEQRGSGLSFDAGTPRQTLTIDQIISDTVAVTDYLRDRFGRKKITLMGHSWGSFIAIQAAARAPDRYDAYVGMAQVSRQMASEKLAYDYMIGRYAAAGDMSMVDRLRRYPIPEMDVMPAGYRALRDEAMHRLGIGTTHAMKSVEWGIFVPVMLSPSYTLGEKINLWRGKWSDYSTKMWNRLLTRDLTVEVPKLEVPTYFFSGIHDYTVYHGLAKDYFNALQAPIKGFYTFAQSAHSPLFEEPDKARRILEEDVLRGLTSLADPP